MQEVIALVVVVLFVVSAVLFGRLRRLYGFGEQRGLPRELIGAEIAFAERTFRSHRRRLVAKLDRAYRTEGELRLVELKTRARNVVYMSDVIELSVQRLAVQDETREAVSTDAWVIVQSPRTGARRPHKVRLLGPGDIEAMTSRYRAIVSDRVDAPTPARSPAQCAQCGHRARCSAKFGDRD